MPQTDHSPPDPTLNLLQQLLTVQQQILEQLTQQAASLASLVNGLTPFGKE